MIRLIKEGVFLNRRGEREAVENTEEARRRGRGKTIAGRILSAHNEGSEELLKLRFDAMLSPDNNYVSILQTARASGLTRFPLPYLLSNCHNTLCAVGGTIPEDDHAFGLSNARRYGGIFLPPYCGVLHQYMREMQAGGGKLILGSDSHTRYGALGTMGIGEGGGELVKQLLGKSYDIAPPEIIAVRLSGTPRAGIGPMDVALALIAETFAGGFVKNKVLEFVGEGIFGLSMEYRMGIDVMTTETAALSSVWCTDEKTREYLREHGRPGEYRELYPEDGAYYDGMIELELGAVEAMIALPFHPSRALPIRKFKENMLPLLQEIEEEGKRIKGEKGEPFSILSHLRDGGFYPDQALVSGCAGGMFENILAVSDILRAPRAEKAGGPVPEGEAPERPLSLHLNPASLPIMEDLMTQGIASELSEEGVTLRPCICGPCFGVTDVPANNQLSIRHVTRNYPNREGSKPGQGQMAAVFLMDARSIAATVRNGGRLTAATELTGVEYRSLPHRFNPRIYEGQVKNFFGRENKEAELVRGPNIADWPEMPVLKEHLLLKVAGSYQGSVTTDELVPSGEASSYRSNPEKLSEYTLIGRDPAYLERARAVRALSAQNFQEEASISFGSLIVSEQIGDGSSREQAASSQKVLGGFANLAKEYATKRYRSNLINWGILPLCVEETAEWPELPVGSLLFLEHIGEALREGRERLRLWLLRDVSAETEEELRGLSPELLRERTAGCISVSLGKLTEEERKILLSGCLINYYKA